MAEPAVDENEDWQTAEQPAAPEGQTAERILNQDEIDSLLGFGVGEEEGDGQHGVRAKIVRAHV